MLFWIFRYSCSIFSFSRSSDTLISWSSKFFLTVSCLRWRFYYPFLITIDYLRLERDRRISSSSLFCCCSSYLIFMCFSSLFLRLISAWLLRVSAMDPPLLLTRSKCASFWCYLTALLTLSLTSRDFTFSSLLILISSNFFCFFSILVSMCPRMRDFFFLVNSSL